MTDKLIIFDTTLRDGEQSPGASMTREEKLRIARQLERMKVDVMEAGFAASSNGDFEAIRAIADVIKDSIVCSLARANDRDISRAAEALKGANAWRIHTFIATSPLHMEKKLRMSPEQVLEQARNSVRFARNLTADVEFSAEDGYRSEIDFLARVCEAVIAEGATTINIPDTVGYAIPELYGNFIRELRAKVPNSDKAIWSVHCHNDLGMAVANSLAGVKIGGARQVECTINGLGERAGNCAMEEIVMAIKTRRDYFGLDVGVDTRQIMPASRLVSQTTGFVVQPNKAVVGANAFAHASGIHQDGVLKARDTYEIMRAEDVGLSANKIVLGKLSGRNAFKQRLQELGIELDSEAEINAAFAKFKELADRKSEIFDEDIIALVSDESVTPEQEHYRLLSLSQRSETGERPQCDLLLQRYCAALKRHGKVGFIASAFPELLPARARELLHGEGVAALQGVEDGLAAWGRIARYRQRRAALLERGEAALVPICPGPLAGDGYLLDEWQSKQALKPFGLPLPQGVLSTPGQAREAALDLGFPLVLKAVSAALPHKTEAGGVALGLRNEAALEAALFDMRESLARHAPQLVFERVLLERMAGAPLAELIVGVKREEGFGLALVIGAGGILVELLRDSRSLLLPTTDAAIRDALLSLRSAPLLSGFRGRPAVCMEALVAAIRAVAEFACEHAERLLELDVNPLLADAEGALAVDALIRLANG